MTLYFKMEEKLDDLRIGPAERPFSIEEERAEERKRTEELKPIFDGLDSWRYESLWAPIIIGYFA